MEVHHGGWVAITLDEREVSDVGRQLVEAIRLGWVVRGDHPPRLLLQLADQVNKAARSSGSRNLPEFRDRASVPSSGQPVLTVQEAGRVAGVSEGFVRRLARRGAVEAVRGSRSAWLIDASSLTAWMGQRRKEHQRTAA